MEGRVFVITHKRVNIPMMEGHPEYVLIQTGDNRAESLGYQTACEGDNIADQNSYYADLTVHYWIWKNANYDYVGINHYCRFLYCNSHLITGDEIRGLLELYDILVPTKEWLYGMNVEEQWKLYHYYIDLLLARESVARIYPECVESFEKVMKLKAIHICNMFITKQAIFNEYCEWVFPILEDVKNRTDRRYYSSESLKRVGGFLSERLFNVWLDYKKYSTYELGFLVCAKNQFDI